MLNTVIVVRSNVSNCEVFVFYKGVVNGYWKREKYRLSIVSSYIYLNIIFSSNGAWDTYRSY